jgi:hypothetical protein
MQRAGSTGFRPEANPGRSHWDEATGTKPTRDMDVPAGRGAPLRGAMPAEQRAAGIPRPGSAGEFTSPERPREPGRKPGSRASQSPAGRGAPLRGAARPWGAMRSNAQQESSGLGAIRDGRTRRAVDEGTWRGHGAPRPSASQPSSHRWLPGFTGRRKCRRIHFAGAAEGTRQEAGFPDENQLAWAGDAPRPRARRGPREWQARRRGRQGVNQ